MVAVLLPTYNRKDILLQTILRLDKYLLTKEHVKYFVAEAGDEPEKTAFSLAYLPRVAILGAPKHNLGASFNLLIREASKETDVVLQMDDDHWLSGYLDIDEYLKTLRNPEDLVKWIRLMGVAFHYFDARLHGNYWRVDWNSPELYITSNRPHLKHVAWHQHFGPYQEGLKLGATEESFCHTCIDVAKSHPRPPVVGIPVDIRTETLWQHVGHSWQEQGY